MNVLATRRIQVGEQLVELWEEVFFDCSPRALRLYAARGAWVTLFNALALQAAPLRSE